MVRYGRCMSKQESKELKRTMELDGSREGLIPVFDSPGVTEKRIREMDVNQLKNYFRRIGVRSPQAVVFFDINDSRGIVGPIPQSNGLREYKIPEGTRISEYTSIRL